MDFTSAEALELTAMFGQYQPVAAPAPKPCCFLLKCSKDLGFRRMDSMLCFI